MTKVFVCEICSTPLGKVDLEDLSVPMTAGMFQSLDAKMGIPVPFQPILDFPLFRCRQCKARPFKDADHITCLNDKGFRVRYDINKIGAERKLKESNQAKIDAFFEEDEPEGFQCKCGKTYKHQSSLARHKAKCNG